MPASPAPGPLSGARIVRVSSFGQGLLPQNPLCLAITAMPRRARRAYSAGLQPSRTNTSGSAGVAASPAVRSGAAPEGCRAPALASCTG